MVLIFINWTSINYVKVNFDLRDTNIITIGLIKILSVVFFYPLSRGYNGSNIPSSNKKKPAIIIIIIKTPYFFCMRNVENIYSNQSLNFTRNWIKIW